jgi:hypothetical protein
LVPRDDPLQVGDAATKSRVNSTRDYLYSHSAPMPALDPPLASTPA